jgi:hypothetical protein
MATRMNWKRARPMQLRITVGPTDDLGRRADRAMRVWARKLPPKQRRYLAALAR